MAVPTSEETLEKLNAAFNNLADQFNRLNDRRSELVNQLLEFETAHRSEMGRLQIEMKRYLESANTLRTILKVSTIPNKINVRTNEVHIYGNARVERLPDLEYEYSD